MALILRVLSICNANQEVKYNTHYLLVNYKSIYADGLNYLSKYWIELEHNDCLIGLKIDFY